MPIFFNFQIGSRYKKPPSIKSVKMNLEKSTSTTQLKRPKNSFIYYRQINVDYIREIFIQKKLIDIEVTFSKVAASLWRNEPKDVRDGYEAMAMQDRLRMALLYPDYKFIHKKSQSALKLKDKQRINIKPYSLTESTFGTRSPLSPSQCSPSPSSPLSLVSFISQDQITGNQDLICTEIVETMEYQQSKTQMPYVFPIYLKDNVVGFSDSEYWRIPEFDKAC